jgi:hypothetical protein
MSISTGMSMSVHSIKSSRQRVQGSLQPIPSPKDAVLYLQSCKRTRSRELGYSDLCRHPRHRESVDSTSTTSSDDKNASAAAKNGTAGSTVAGNHPTKLQKRNPQAQVHAQPVTEDHMNQHGSQYYTQDMQHHAAAPLALSQPRGEAVRNLSSADSTRPSVASIASIKSGIVGHPQPHRGHTPVDHLPNIQQTNGKFMGSSMDSAVMYVSRSTV